MNTQSTPHTSSINIKTRFAPSPTGYMHIANARTALLNYKMSQLHANSQFILRLDDTDTSRCTSEFTDQIIDDLSWLNISYTQIFKQSQRSDLYTKIMQDLLSQGIVYPAYETPQELELQRQKQIAMKQPPIYTPTAKPHANPHYRFRLINHEVQWHDLILGHIAFKDRYSSDPIIMREDGSFTYIFASIVDDFDMKITHIIRGNDHVSNSGIQLQMLEQLNKTYNQNHTIQFAHFPLISDLTGHVFSKRDGSMALKNLRHLNPHIISSFLLNLGRSHIHDTWTYQDYGKANIKCDITQLYKMNAHWLANLTYSEAQSTLGITMSQSLWTIAQHNSQDLHDITRWQSIHNGKIWSITQFINSTTSSSNIHTHSNNQQILSLIIQSLTTCTTWEQVHKHIQHLNPHITTQSIAQIIRFILTGQTKGAKIQELFDYFGVPTIITRLTSSQTTNQ